MIDSALGLFVIESEPELAILPEVDGMVVKVRGKCVACGCVCTLQRAGVPQTVQKLIRVHVREKLLAFIGLQGDGTQPFEIQQMRVLTSDAAQFEKLFKFQLAAYQKWMLGTQTLPDERRPCSEVQDLLKSPSDRKRLRLQNTSDGSGL